MQSQAGPRVARGIVLDIRRRRQVQGPQRREHAPNADLYQLLAYVTALNLPGGMLIYAKGEREPATYHIRHSGKRLEVAALDLSGTLDDVLNRVESLAKRVGALRDQARSLSRAA